jgi:hypothetical protein
MEETITILPAEINDDMSKFAAVICTVYVLPGTNQNAIRFQVSNEQMNLLLPGREPYFLVTYGSKHYIVNAKEEFYEAAACRIGYNYDSKRNPHAIKCNGSMYDIIVMNPQREINIANKIVMVEAIRRYTETIDGGDNC